MSNPKDFLIVLDDGHGMETAGKQTPKFPDGSIMKENEFNREVVKLLDIDLRRIGFATLLTAPTDIDTPLANRVEKANNAKADLLISIHANAFNGIWDSTKGGIETYHYPGSLKGKRLAECVHENLVQGTSLINRGIKQANFMILRETKMPATLCECGFMDVRADADKLRTTAYRKECAIEISRGICLFCGIPYPEIPVISIISFTPILGPAQATVGQAREWARQRKATDEFISLAELYWKIAPTVNIRPEVAYAQSGKETGFGHFGRATDSTFHNPCGLKTTTGTGESPDAHHRFPDWETGILAHVQHAALYAGNLVEGVIADPRHFAFIRGRAKTVEELGGQSKWAPNPNYGNSIVNDYLKPLMETIEPVQVPQLTEGEKAMKRLIDEGIIFSSHDLKSNITWEEQCYIACRLLDRMAK